MTTTSPSFAHHFFRFVMIGVLTAVVVGSMGYVPTLRLSGTGGVTGMVLGCGISLVGTLVGAIPICLSARRTMHIHPNAILGASALRLVTVLILVLPSALSGLVETAPLLVWVAIAYMCLLLTETAYAAYAVNACNSRPEHSQP